MAPTTWQLPQELRDLPLARRKAPEEARGPALEARELPTESRETPGEPRQLAPQARRLPEVLGVSAEASYGLAEPSHQMPYQKRGTPQSSNGS